VDGRIGKVNQFGEILAVSALTGGQGDWQDDIAPQITPTTGTGALRNGD
jgi:hypothetical protein